CMSFGCSGVGGGLDGQGETGWPTYAIDSDATRNRAMEWMSFTYDMSGELYYEVTMSFFSGDPWTNQTAFGGSGDGTLSYPGTTTACGTDPGVASQTAAGALASGGCSSAGGQSIWLAIPLLALVLLRRRRVA